MTQNEFWLLFRKFVQYHPSNEAMPCRRLDTWAVLKNFEADLNDPALGATILDRDKATFFSRQWAGAKYNPNAIRHRYPILAANIVEITSERVKKKERIDRLVFDLAVLDKLEDPKGPATACRRRNEIDIFQDCHDRLQECFSYLSGLVVATMTPGGTFIGPEDELLHLVDTEQITSYVLEEKEGRAMQRRMKEMTENSKAYPWRGGLSNLYGVYAPELIMEFHVCEEELDLEFPDYTDTITERENY